MASALGRGRVERTGRSVAIASSSTGEICRLMTTGGFRQRRISPEAKKGEIHRRISPRKNRQLNHHLHPHFVRIASANALPACRRIGGCRTTGEPKQSAWGSSRAPSTSKPRRCGIGPEHRKTARSWIGGRRGGTGAARRCHDRSRAALPCLPSRRWRTLRPAWRKN